jgi:hypothetical protein
MKLTMYAASVPVFSRQLGNLQKILEKAAVHAEQRKIDPAVLVAGRLFPDMLPLSKQVQIATDHAKGAAARLAGLEPPKYEDTETTFAELIERIAKTIAYLGSFSTAQFEGADERPVSLTMRGNTLTFGGTEYLVGYAMPNFYFHVTTAYAILRHSGVEIGKGDFLGKV